MDSRPEGKMRSAPYHHKIDGENRQDSRFILIENSGTDDICVIEKMPRFLFFQLIYRDK
jgi:hypothetical protein